MEKVTCNIEAWNQYFSMMTGKKFTDLYEADRMPEVLSMLQDKSKILANKLGECSSYPNKRTNSSKV